MTTGLWAVAGPVRTSAKTALMRTAMRFIASFLRRCVGVASPIAHVSMGQHSANRGGKSLIRPVLHPVRSATDRHDAGARNLDQPDWNHERDEALDLFGRAGDLEHEAFRAGVDDAGAEG